MCSSAEVFTFASPLEVLGALVTAIEFCGNSCVLQIKENFIKKQADKFNQKVEDFSLKKAPKHMAENEPSGNNFFGRQNHPEEEEGEQRGAQVLSRAWLLTFADTFFKNLEGGVILNHCQEYGLSSWIHLFDICTRECD
jgi:hypothetical protein